MDKDTITRLAKEAGFVVDEVSRQHQPNCIFHTWHMVDEGLARFAALVAAHEREAIWNIVFEYAGRDDLSDAEQSLLKHLADLIRERT